MHIESSAMRLSIFAGVLAAGIASSGMVQHAIGDLDDITFAIDLAERIGLVPATEAERLRAHVGGVVACLESGRVAAALAERAPVVTKDELLQPRWGHSYP